MSPPTLLPGPQTLLPPPLRAPYTRARSCFPILSRPLSRRNLTSLCRSSISSSFQSPFQSDSPQQQQREDEEDDHVIGDCLVFEDGIFEDPYLQKDFDSAEKKPQKKKSAAEIKPEDLVPDSWKDVLDEINMTKKERRKMVREMEFGSRIEKKRRGYMPVGNVNVKANVGQYLTYKEAKLAQLKPIVLDNPTFPAEKLKNEEEGVGESRGLDGNGASSSRVAPKNPRWAVYGGTLDDITEFFNSPDYEPRRSAAATKGRPKLFTREEKILLNKCRPDLAAATSGKWLPLQTLAASGEFDLMDALLKHNVDINGADKDGLTALHRAIISKKQAIMNYLLRESANPFSRDKDGASPMHYAVQAASIPAIKVLLLYNVDINAPDNDGWTPLHVAVQARRADIVRLLLIKGADKTLKNRDGLTPLDLCLYAGREVRNYEVIRLLMRLPKTVKNSDRRTNSPSMLQLPGIADDSHKTLG